MKSKKIFIAVCFFSLISSSICAAAEDHGHEENRKGQEHDDHGDHEEHAEEVHLRKASQNMIGLEFVEVKKAPLLSSLEVIGEIAQDSENAVHVTSDQAGILNKINVKLGDVVEKEMPLCVVKTRDGSLHEILASHHGIIMAVYLKEGDMVDEISSLVTVIDPDVMKASFNLYEKDLAGVRLGQRVKVKTIAYPQEEFQGEIVYISPQVDIKTRTVKIRVNIRNDEHLLKFGMYLTGRILVPLAEQAVVVPEEAVQQVEGKTVVFISDEDEQEEFLMREVRLGKKAEGFVEVIGGVQEGDIVVGKGSFYLKAELQKGELGHGHAH